MDARSPSIPSLLFHGNSTARWEGDTLVVESIGFDDRTYIMPNGWFHSDELRSPSATRRPSMNYLIVEITVEDPKVLVEAVEIGASPLDAGRWRTSTSSTARTTRNWRSSKLRELELKQGK